MITDRKTIDAKYKWDLTAIYKTPAAFENDYMITDKMIKEFGKNKDFMLRDAKSFCKTLTDMTQIDLMIGRLWQYASLNFAVDTSDSKNQALNTRVRNLAVKAGEATWFVTPYMLKLDDAKVAEWFKEYPALESHRRFIEKTMREKPHTLSDECEIVMSKMQDAMGSHTGIRSIFTNSDLRFGKIKGEAQVSGGDLKLLFAADKMLKIIKGLSAVSNNSSIAAISQVADQYDGMSLGMTFAK